MPDILFDIIWELQLFEFFQTVWELLYFQETVDFWRVCEIE